MTKRRRAYRLRALAVWSVALVPLVAGCARSVPYRLQGRQGVHTLTDLHPDEVRARLYSVNYQQGGLIPVCTPVRIDRVTSREMIFTRLDTGKQYQYLFHSSLQEPIPAHLDKYFGTQCPEVSATSGVDAEGIEQGRVIEGMSKRAVILAVGYPPPHETPTLDLDIWKYWRNRFDTFNVHFENGHVVRIQD